MEECVRELKNVMQGLARTASRVLSEINWSSYGYEAVGEGGELKYQGFLFGWYNPSSGTLEMSSYGNLSDRNASVTTLLRMFDSLKNPFILSSLAERAPERDCWGGAICSTDESSLIFGGTGFPEIVSHLLLACVMYQYDMLSKHEFLVVTSVGYVAEALKSCKMSEARYLELFIWINNIATIHCADV
jgi:hypothetical protein